MRDVIWRLPRCFFPMKDTDLHRKPVSTELRDFYLEQRVFFFLENQAEFVFKVKDLGCQKRLQPSSARTMFCWSRFLDKHIGTGLVEEAFGGLKAKMTATALEHPNMGAHECLGIARAVAVSNGRSDVLGCSFIKRPWEEQQIWTLILHTRIRGTSCSTKLNLWMRPVATISNGCKTLRSIPPLDAPESGVTRSELHPRTEKHRSSCRERMSTIGARRQKKGSFKSTARVLCNERERRIHGSTSIDARCAKTESMCVAQSSMTNDESRPCTAETRFWERGSPSRATCLSPNAMDSPRSATKAPEGSAPGHFNRHSRRRRGSVDGIHLETCRQTSLTHQHRISRKHENDSSQKRTWDTSKSATACQQASARRHLRKLSRTGAQVTQHWRSILR